MGEDRMTDVSIDVVVQDDAGCLTLSGPLRLLARLMNTFEGAAPTGVTEDPAATAELRVAAQQTPAHHGTARAVRPVPEESGA
jgi:hypothetical protein